MMLKRLLVGLTAFVILGAFESPGLGQSNQRKFVELISPRIKNASLRLANVSRYETGDDSKVTWKELFERIESDVGEIEKGILEVQMISPPKKDATKEPAIEYLRGVQDLLRALNMKFRRSLALSAASEEMHKERLQASGSSAEARLERYVDVLEKQQKAAAELFSSVSGVASSVKALKGALARLAAVARFPSDVLIDPAILEAIAKKNKSKAEDAPQPSSLVEDLLAPSTRPDAGATPAAKAARGDKKPKAKNADPLE